MPNDIVIDYLANQSRFVSDLAAYSHNEWRTVYGRREQTYEDVLKSYQQRADIGHLPLALVALGGDKLVGTISLKEQDLEIRPKLSPWLGGLFVVRSWRRKGVATQLINRAIDEARHLGIAKLYLWTPSAEPLYARLGWLEMERVNYCGYNVCVMQRNV